MLPSELRILRVFGLPAAEVTAALRTAREDGCPGLRLLERDGEFAVCVQVSAPTQSMAEEYCEKWVQKLSTRFGDAVYGMGEISLAQAALDALLKKRRIFVAADEPTGRLVGAMLRPLHHSEAAFDFGTQTYANAANVKKIKTPEAVLKRFPGDVVQAAAGRAQLALEAGGADYAAVYMPATVGQAPFVLVCDKRTASALALAPDMGDAAITNTLLDLLRRRALGLHMPQAAITFRLGHERPMLIFSPEGQGAAVRGNTLRFSLRCRPVQQADDFEPSEGYGVSLPGGDEDIEKAVFAAAEGDADGEAAPQPDTTGSAITFEAAGDDTPAPGGNDALPDPLAIRTAGAAAAAAARARRVNSMAGKIHRAATQAETHAAPITENESFATEIAPPAPQPAPSADPVWDSRAERDKPVDIDIDDAQHTLAKSILDEDIPDFSASLDPEALAAANALDEKTGPRSPDELQRAADLLFGANDDEDEGRRKKKAAKKRGKKDAEPAKAAAPAVAGSSPIRTRSLEMIERSERRHRRNTVIAVILVLLVLAGIAGGIYWFTRNDMGVVPAAGNYGTAGYDTLAEKYLATAMQKQEGVYGYIGFPGADGQLIYNGESGAHLASESYVGSAAPSNTVIDCGGTALAAMASLETAKANSGFTLYLPGASYDYKLVAVYYADAADAANPFDPAAYTDLSGYYDYMDFVMGFGIRNLYDTGVKIGTGASFLTLASGSDASGARICVTGRLIGETENAALNPAAIAEAESSLLTAAQYAAAGQQAPDAAALMTRQLAAYSTTTAAASNTSAAGQGDGQGADALDGQITELAQRTQELLSATDVMLAGLTDIAGSAGAAETELNKGAEGTLPEQTVAVAELAAAPAATEVPTAAPTEAPSEAPAQSNETILETVEATPAPEDDVNTGEDTGEGTAGETINVNMNGVDQTMDLVECLAMIAQNELGASAPAEAYKAQCVAAHCWIISQSGYPAVLGAAPGAAALAAAQEVAHVLVTYNGNVCFTPYFASASTGTASAAEVWGNDRPWLQAVESPYDATVGTNWNTNGSTTGCARFSRQALQDCVLEKLGIDLSGTDPNSWFKILSANQYGWVAQMQIGPDDGQNTTCSGRWFRETLTARQSVDGRSLRSQCFTFTYDAELDCFIFDVYGYGHGCGMSQWGAIGYANNGWDYASILTHYYPGTTLEIY